MVKRKIKSSDMFCQKWPTMCSARLSCLVSLFIILGLVSSELANNGENRVESSTTKHPSLLDSIEGTEFLAEMALYKYRFWDHSLKGQTVIPSNVPFSGNQGVSNKFVETLSSISQVYKSRLNKTMRVDEQSIFKNICDHYASITDLRIQGSPGQLDFNSLCDLLVNNECLSNDMLLGILDQNTGNNLALTLSQAVSRICPLMLFQNQLSSCSKVESTNNDGELYESTQSSLDQLVSTPRKRPSASSVWGFGFLFVTVVSCCSLVGVALLPLFSKKVYHTVLVTFEGLAVGSLSASALFHLLPQAFGLIDKDNYHDYLWKSLVIFLGIYVFFITERCMKIIIQRKQKRKQKKALRNADTASLTLSPSDLSSNGIIVNEKSNHDGNLPEVLIEASIMKAATGDDYVNHKPNELDVETNVCLPSSRNTHSHHGHGHYQAPNDESPVKREIATVAWMIIFGDGLHNFIDGLSMGAAFSDSILSGISISVAVICEEFPHELGDFAVLLSSGMTMKQALMYNFLSACTCYLGLIFGIILGDFSGGGPYIFAFAGGMFLYISLVDMVNELSEALENASEKGTKEMLRVFGLQNMGILIGVVVMFVMARYSEKINFVSTDFN